MNLATDNGMLNLAGVLMFTERPEWIKPQFVMKAIRYPGNKIHTSEYIDTEDFSGPLRKIFDDAMAFIMRNLHKIQAGRGVNAPGLPEIPESVFEELLVNALVHRDYLVNEPIRLFIFDNRIEIISPGHLPDNLTVEKIRTGNSNIRNPLLVSYVAKGLLPYHGLGSGIKRSLDQWPSIDFNDDRDGCLFTATIHRKALSDDNSESISIITENGLSIATEQENILILEQVGTKLEPSREQVEILRNCLTEKAIIELMQLTGRTNRSKFRDQVIKPLLKSGWIELTVPEKPSSSKQKYRLTKKGYNLLNKLI